MNSKSKIPEFVKEPSIMKSARDDEAEQEFINYQYRSKKISDKILDPSIVKKTLFVQVQRACMVSLDIIRQQNYQHEW